MREPRMLQSRRPSKGLEMEICMTKIRILKDKIETPKEDTLCYREKLGHVHHEASFKETEQAKSLNLEKEHLGRWSSM